VPVLLLPHPAHGVPLGQWMDLPFPFHILIQTYMTAMISNKIALNLIEKGQRKEKHQENYY
jgi:hypothetical protein